MPTIKLIKADAADMLRNDMVGLDVLGRPGGRSKVAWILGADAIGKGARSVGGIVGGAARRTGRAFRLAFGREEVRPLRTRETDPGKRFRIAQRVYGKDDADVDRMALAAKRQFTAFFLALVAAVCWGIITSADTGSPVPPVLRHIFAWSVVPPLLAVTARASFRHWQLSQRRLGTVAEWWRDERANWCMPTGAAWTALLMLFSTAMLAPSVAHAAGYDWLSGKLPDNDLWYRLLLVLAPGVGPVGDSASPWAAGIAAAFAASNAALLSIGSAMLAWHTIAGIVSTAKDGALLGSRWHEIWAPVRTGLGITTLAPMSGGYCAAQMLGLYIAVAGGGLANAVWDGYLSIYGGQQDQQSASTVSKAAPAANASPLLQVQAREYVKTFAAKEICFETIAQYQAANGRTVTVNNGVFGSGITFFGLLGDEQIALGQWPTAKAVEVTDSAMESLTGTGQAGGSAYDRLQWGTTTKYLWDYGPVCGTVEINPAAGGDLDGQAIPGTVFSTVVKDDAKQTVEARRAAAKAVANALDQMRGGLKLFAQDWVGGLTKGKVNGQPKVEVNALDQRLRDAMDGFAGAMTSGADPAYTALVQQVGQSIGGKMATEAHNVGWAGAGAFYMTLSNVQRQLFQASVFTLATTPIDVEPLDKSPLVEQLVKPADKAKRSAASYAPGTVSAFDAYWETMVHRPAKPMIDGEAMKAGVAEGPVEDVVNSAVLWTLKKAIGGLELNPLDPIGSMVGFGHTLFWIFYGMVAAGALVSAATTLMPGGLVAKGAAAAAGAAAGAGGGGGLLGAVGSLAFLYSLLKYAVFAAAIVHAYVIPMIPYIHWTMFVAGMLTITAEILVGMPILAFQHIRMDGAELVEGPQRSGYLMSFNALLRPSLGLFGMFLSYPLLGAMALFLQVTFYPAAVGAMAGHLTGLIGGTVMLIVLLYLHYQLTLRSFSLIVALPDRISSWFGASAAGLGEENEAQGHTRWVVGGISNRVEGMLGSVGQKVTRENRNGGSVTRDRNGRGNTGDGGGGNDKTETRAD